MRAKKVLAMILAGAICASALTGCGINKGAAAATMKDQTITMGMANFCCRFQQANIEDYYKSRTRDKKNHSIQWFWLVTTIKDIVFKGVTIAASTLGLVYIVIVGSNDWSLMLMAIVNLVLFVCFGLLALNQAYEYYNNVYVNYMREQLARAKDGYVKNDITEVINDDNGGRKAVKEPAGTGREE